MARKKKHAEHVNHERWLVSYADFITLLFAFFVVMFAVSQVDSKKVGRFTESFSKAVGVDMFQDPGKGIMPGATEGVPADPTGEQGPTSGPGQVELSNIESSLRGPPEGAKDTALGKIQLIARRNELVIRLPDGLLFDSGNDAMHESAARVVEQIALELKKHNVDIRVEGHTDNRPIHTARFRSNWDLSTSRATAVVAMLATEGLDPVRLSAAGYGEFHPIAPNATDEGRKLNRRVDLVVSVSPKKQAEEKPAEKPTDEKHDEKPAPAKHESHGGHEEK